MTHLAVILVERIRELLGRLPSCRWRVVIFVGGEDNIRDD